MKKILTLILVLREQEILLGFKKRGFGKNLWNGFGGKIEAGETIEEAAQREFFEETGASINDIEKFAISEFRFKDSGEILEVHIYKATNISGEIQESEEMIPKWFPLAEIPYDKMWPDDKYWLPLFLENKKIIANFLFDSMSSSNILEYKIEEKENL